MLERFFSLRSCLPPKGVAVEISQGRSSLVTPHLLVFSSLRKKTTTKKNVFAAWLCIVTVQPAVSVSIHPH